MKRVPTTPQLAARLRRLDAEAGALAMALAAKRQQYAQELGVVLDVLGIKQATLTEIDDRNPAKPVLVFALPPKSGVSPSPP